MSSPRRTRSPSRSPKRRSKEEVEKFVTTVGPPNNEANVTFLYYPGKHNASMFINKTTDRVAFITHANRAQLIQLYNSIGEVIQLLE